MDNRKNNFIELKKLLTIAVGIVEENNTLLEARIGELEQRVAYLERRLEAFEADSSDGAVSATTAATVAGECLPDENGSEDESEELSVEDDSDGENGEFQDENDFSDADDIEDDEFPDEYGEEDPEEVKDSLDNDEEVLPEENGSEDESEELSVEDDSWVEMEKIDLDDGCGEETNIDRYGGNEEIELSVDQSIQNEIQNEISKNGNVPIINDASRPDWFDWEVDYPGPYIDDVYKGISFNDRYEFVKELFNTTNNLSEAEYRFKDTLDIINELATFKDVVEYIRAKFPDWDEYSDEVYRFYMIVRRKFNKRG